MWWFPVSPRRFCPSVGGVTLIFLLLAVCLATGGIHVPVKIQDKDADATLKGIQAPIPLPTNFEERLSTEMRMTTAEKSRRMGDPAPIYRDKDSHTRGEDQARALGRQARGFFSFWPFSIEITKGKGADHHPGGGGGWGPSHYGSYTSWMTESQQQQKEHGKNNGGEGYPGWDANAHPYQSIYHGGYDPNDPEVHYHGASSEKKGLTDEEILKSEHYRKYLKYKHKKIKILKKKLKWKRIFQKVLQKHINFADKIVPY